MRRHTMLLCLLLGLSACDRSWVGDATPRAGQEEAIRLAWGQTYGMTAKAPPPILWRDGIGCDGTYAWNENGSCVAGMFFDDWHIELANYPGPLDETTIAHELCHAFKFATTGDADQDHHSDCFTPGGRSDTANATLVLNGL